MSWFGIMTLCVLLKLAMQIVNIVNQLTLQIRKRLQPNAVKSKIVSNVCLNGLCCGKVSVTSGLIAFL